jgi:ATP-dependent Lon protease
VIDIGAGDGELAPEKIALPGELPVLPLRDSVTYPDTLTPLAIGQDRSVQLVNDVLIGNRLLVMVASRDPELETPAPDQLYDVGVAGMVARMLKVPDGSLRILVQGGQRVRIQEWVREEPYLAARVTELPDELEEGPELTALMRNVQQTFSHIIEEVPYLPEELQMAVANLDDPSALSHLIAGALRIKTEERQALLEEVNVARRLRRLSEILARELDIVAIGSRIQSQVHAEMEKGQREWVLRQQLKAIQDELGEQDPAEAEVDELRSTLQELELPENVRTQVDRELSRLEKIPQAAAEHGVIRTYLEWMASLPWGKGTEDNLDLGHAREVLDADHYGIAKVKDRILEFLAVRKLKPDARGSILCFAGPPGVGKTSLGQSIARALGRKFERISVGGVRDESEIRGHRRTYIGAMPGTIIRALRDAESHNPVFMIDEIDKMGADYRGDPASAMLEVLDPEQNSTFRDHYLDVAFDLSRVMFICTANDLDRVPGPLHDRMEVIALAGYTEEEKLQIAKRYLVPRQIERNGLKRSQVGFTDAGIREIITSYTREAGVRSLEREIGSACRKVAVQAALGTLNGKVSVTAARAREMLGRPRFFADVRRRTSEPGVATGLAWTPVGGDVLFVEASAMPGKGKLTITGQLGDVMRESAEAALSYVRGHADLPEDWFAKHDLHVHVPAGAIPKDGPSAGVTMATALMSLVSGRPVRDDVAMTGELTLTGQVLPIGGLKEKALAAQRAGIHRVLAPRRNEGDLEDIPEPLRKDMEFVWVGEVGEVFDAALSDGAGRR